MAEKTSLKLFQDAMKKCREDQRISARKMQTDTHTQGLYEFEKGERNPSIDTIIKWCEYLGVTLLLEKAMNPDNAARQKKVAALTKRITELQDEIELTLTKK